MYLLQFLVGTYFVLAVAAEVFTQHNISCYPHVVRFSDRSGRPTKLNVDLKAVNMPTDKGSDFNVIAYFKRGERYAWKSTLKLSSKYIPNEVVRVLQNINSDWNNCYIAYCFYKEKQGYCEMGKDTLYNVIILKYSEEITNSDCVAGRCELTLDLKNYCKNFDPTLLAQRLPYYSRDTPKLHFYDMGSGDFESKVKITCSVVGQKFDLLSLYQDTETKHELLKIIQHVNDEEGDIILTMIKTLVNSDKKSKIYCVKHKPDDPSYKTESNVKTLNNGDHKYQSQEPADTARVSVEPAADTAWFRRDEPLSLVCHGTTLLDHRNLTWYIRDQNTLELEVPEPSSQLYDRKTNENRLRLWLNDSHDSKMLFCAQDYHLVWEHIGGRRSVTRYGELAASGNITLKLLDEIGDDAPTGSVSSEGDRKTGADSTSGLGLGLVCGLVVGIALLLVTAAVVARRLCRRKSGEGGHEENQYATAAELTYAVLDLSETGAGAPAKGHDNTSPYVEIVGVYNPRK